MNNKLIEFLKNYIECERPEKSKWEKHSVSVAKAAWLIGNRIKSIDENKAYIYGLLHDVGRIFGDMKINHIFMGYKLLNYGGYNDISRICLTHSFPIKDINQVTKIWDCKTEDYLFLEKYLNGIKYNDYDMLIQLCDVLCDHNGFIDMEERFIDIVNRYGFDESNTIKRFNKLRELKKYFEVKAGITIENILNL